MRGRLGSAGMSSSAGRDCTPREMYHVCSSQQRMRCKLHNNAGALTAGALPAPVHGAHAERTAGSPHPRSSC